jgi:WNK lysine deficient protein kinase
MALDNPHHTRTPAGHGKERSLDVTDPAGRFKRSDEYIAIGPSRVRYKGYDAETGLEVTWHEFLLPRRASSDELQSICTTADRFKSLHHEGLGHLHSYWISPDSMRVTFVTESVCTKSVMDNFLNDESVIRPKVVVKWFRPVLEVLRYLHSLSPPIVHQSIHLSSIFVRGATGAVKVAIPLPFPIDLCSGRSPFKLTATTPPEYLSGEESPASDIWSFGLAVLTVLTKQLPYDECTTPLELAQKLWSCEKPASFSLLTDDLASDLIGACLRRAEDRWTAEQLLNHSYFTRGESKAEPKAAGPGMVVLFTAAGGDATPP